VQTARDLFDAGKLNEAIQAVGVELRDRPTDTQRRTFLFELLCFAGNWDRADKQLDALAGDDKDHRMGALLYRAALSAERTRQERFQNPTESSPAASVSGTLNGAPFQSLEDADPRVGARLEVLAGGNYLWIPFEHIAELEMQPPKRLRDLLWAPATIHSGPGFQGSDLGEVLLPVLSPFSWKHADDAVRLGRMTVWEEGPDGQEIPFGQKMFLLDGAEIPLLELRKLEISQLRQTDRHAH
jgi:type VI secretion system protein ImpE